MEPVSVVIPTLNEAGSIGRVIREIPAAYAGDVIVADSGSRDGTARIAREAGRGSSTAGTATAGPAPAARRPPTGAPRHRLHGRRRGGSRRPDRADRRSGAARRAGFRPRLPHPRRPRARRHALAPGPGRPLAASASARSTGPLQRHVRVPGHRPGRLAGSGAAGDDLRLEHRDADAGGSAGLRIDEVPLPYRCRTAGASKVAGSFRGTLRAGTKIVTTFLRVAATAAPAHPAPRP